ncbi:MAG: hemerythrin domain-containing protein [Ottowia sp.]|uniref:hemerythrin domain-containing protein n=1 Tax=Ottowia sp. TaxID=1898956 RepID=UPI0039E21AF6
MLNTAPRLDLYAQIHKALRAQMMDTLHVAGRVDVRNPADLHDTCERVLALADVCTGHIAHENDFVHPALEAHRPGTSAEIASEHARHLDAIAIVRDTVAALRTASPGARDAAALTLYRTLALFIAENFVHMHAEETEHNRVLWAFYSDEELLALHGRIAAAIPPHEHLDTMRWMIPAMTPAERAQVLCGLRAEAPAPMFNAVLDAVLPHLRTDDKAKLMRALAPQEELAEAMA